MKSTAIILAAGQGKRMQSDVAKQYLLIQDKPVLYYSLTAFENADEIDTIILVVGQGEQEYVKEQIVDRYGFRKVEAIVTGGRERYHSVYNGLMAITACDYLFIHDGARPLVDAVIIKETYEGVKQYGAVATGMPVKDTIKIADEEGFIKETPNRETLWEIQTPQAFKYSLIKEAYDMLMDKEGEFSADGIVITDDAMVVETFTDSRVKLVRGSYRNVKVTTPEDLKIMEAFNPTASCIT